jgi:cytochrome c oxidase subunit 3
MATTDVAGGRGGPDRDAEHGAEHEHRSRWPLVAAVGAAALYAGVGLALVGLDLVPGVVPLVLAPLGAVGLVVGLAGWTREAFLARYPGDRADGDSRVFTGGMVLFLVSDVATFAAGFVYYAFVRVGTWPPSDLPPVLGSLVLANTLLLVASSVTLHYAHEGLDEGDRRRFVRALGVTTLLGVVFLLGQAAEYAEFVAAEGFTPASGVYASAFYGLTGLHGLHVTLGVVLLALTLWRARRGAFDAERDTSVRTVSLYWHFVDAVWLVLVAALYVGAVVG